MGTSGYFSGMKNLIREERKHPNYPLVLAPPKLQIGVHSEGDTHKVNVIMFNHTYTINTHQTPEKAASELEEICGKIQNGSWMIKVTGRDTAQVVDAVAEYLGRR